MPRTRGAASGDTKQPQAGAQPAEQTSVGGDSVKGDKVGGDSVRGDKLARDKIGQQFNTGGGAAFLRAITAGTVVGRDQINYYDAQADMVWPEESEESYLKRVYTDFEQEMISRTAPKPGGTTRAAARKYIEPLLSQRQTTVSPTQGVETNTQRGTWPNLIKPGKPLLGLLIGDTNDGKSLLLKKIARDLAQKAIKEDSKYLPIYLSVSRYPFADVEGLLAIAAFASGQKKETLRDTWNTKTRRVTLLIDDADQIPPGERPAFISSIGQLRNSLNDSHSCIIACKSSISPDSLKDQLARLLNHDPRYSEWVLLPLTRDGIEKLLDRYGANDWLTKAVFANKSLELLVSRPGTLAAMVRATTDLQLAAPPQNLAQLYGLLVEQHLFASESQKEDYRYHYGAVKQPLLSYLAFRMLAAHQDSLVVDDALCRDIAEQLMLLEREFGRSRRVMPPDWNAADLLKELFEAPVVNRNAAENYFEFSNKIYRDYFAALHLQRAREERCREYGDIIRQSDLESWFDVLILLSGMPATKSSDQLLSDALSTKPSIAADLWLEKGTVGISHIPDCVASEFNFRRLNIPDRADLPPHPAAVYFRNIARDADPQIALRAVNGMIQLGVDAIDPLLDAVESRSPLVAASAIHALFHMGEFMASGAREAPPLLKIDSGGLSFSNLGACSAAIGDLVLVRAPRTFRAELDASFERLDFDPFAAQCSFELWHTPVAWFAIDHFKRANAVDWISLAAACSTVARCAGLIVAKALQRGSLRLIAQEMTQCAIGYDQLGFSIAKDLSLPWRSITPSDAPQPLIDNALQIYKELRLFFNRTNRSRMLEQNAQEAATGAPAVSVQQGVGKLQGTAVGVWIDELSAQTTAEADLPNLARIRIAQKCESVDGGSLRGIHVQRVMPGRFLAAEVMSLSCDLAIDRCKDGEIQGIVIDEIGRWEGIRARLSLKVKDFQSSKLIGISAVPPKEAISPS